MEDERPLNDPPVDLTPKQMVALAALLGGKTQEEAAAAAGVTDRTIGNWLRDTAFRQHLMDGRVRLWTECTTELHHMTRLARRTLYAALESSDAKWWERVNAARAILELSRRAADTDDLNHRMCQVEEKLDRALAGGEE